MPVSVIIRKLDDPASRIERLLASQTRRLRRQFMVMINGIQDDLVLAELERLIINGQLNEAFAVVQSHAERFATQVNRSYITSAEDTAAVISGRAVVSFDVTNFRAVRVMQENKLNLVREFTQEQVQATRNALTQGISQGVGPREQARLFRQSIGLTQRQEAAVRNYERLLRENSREALDRALRDRRFDRTVANALDSGRPLENDQIRRMVGRYREKYLTYRSETIAQTEALSAVHQGNAEMYQQAIDSGSLKAEDIQREWHTARDPKVRDTHDSMNNQKRAHEEPFTTGAGVSLMYPGDRSAPANERVRCRCAVSTRLKEES